jgi:type IV pilus assembly protein PilC
VAEFICKYADPQGSVHQQVESAGSEQELRERFSEQGLLVYSVKPRRALADLRLANTAPRGRKLNLEQFLIFNQQFVTLMRSGLPILKSLDLLVANVKNRRLAGHLEAIRSQVTSGTPLSQAFQSQGVFPPIYTTSLMAGEKSGSLPEVIDRYVQYQKIALSVRKKILVSLIYPALLVTLVLVLVVFLVTYVVPEFASLYASMDSELPYMTQVLVAVGVTVSENLYVTSFALLAIVGALLWWLRSGRVTNSLDRFKVKIPVFGQIWIKYQVSQLCRLLSTLLHGGIPLMQALETTGQSLGSPLLRGAILRAKQLVKEGQPLSKSLAMAGVFPPLAIEMIQVGESTGALPAMLNSVAEFFDDDVNTLMTAAMSLIEPAIMIFMGIFVAFVLISLYLPIFSLAERI